MISNSPTSPTRGPNVPREVFRSSECPGPSADTVADELRSSYAIGTPTTDRPRFVWARASGGAAEHTPKRVGKATSEERESASSDEDELAESSEATIPPIRRAARAPTSAAA